MILLDVLQGTPEWHESRIGVITASEARVALSRLKRSNELTADARAYVARIALEILSGESQDTAFVTKAMQRGIELEPEARAEYEIRTGRTVLESGFAMTDCRRFGYSTDGLVGKDGIVEFKCPVAPEKILDIWEFGDLSEYYHQIQMGLWITGRRWCDFVMYAPQLRAIGMDLYVKRVNRVDEFIRSMVDGLYEVRDLVDKRVKSLRKLTVEAA